MDYRTRAEKLKTDHFYRVAKDLERDKLKKAVIDRILQHSHVEPASKLMSE